MRIALKTIIIQSYKREYNLITKIRDTQWVQN